jgi:hypothetical protein
MTRHASTAIIAAVLSLIVDSVCMADDKTPMPPVPAQQNNAEFAAIWKADIEAHTNIRYWSVLAGRAQTHEWWIRTLTVLLGVGGVALTTLPRSFGLGGKKSKWWTLGVIDSIGLLILAASLLLFLNAASTSGELATFAKRWTALADQWEALFNERVDISDVELKARADSLRMQQSQIEQSEPEPTDHALLHQAWLVEMHARGLDDWAATQKPPPIDSLK